MIHFAIIGLGEPRVECLSDSIRVNFDTENEFEGHVYVKGHYGHRECRVDATLITKVNLTIPFASCGMRRQRTVGKLSSV
ncbi:unnamed protein product [Enterobius vermicularis]|uniref:ZP domain-containing protein n=1 Tax=Enterobius vermicularis TaxID=51028 RepID=A0A0N4VQY7_ENTVE|nr:unnamed protein product [Enterobius vermicularis]